MSWKLTEMQGRLQIGSKKVSCNPTARAVQKRRQVRCRANMTILSASNA
jgi:hypothetical protein